MSHSSVDQFFDLTKIEGHVDEAALAAIYDQLGPISPERLLGQWKGSSFDTGHPTHKLLRDFKWAGKDFRGVDDVDPIMLYDDNGSRNWCEQYGRAQVRFPCLYNRTRLVLTMGTAP